MARIIWWAALVAGTSYTLPVLAGWDGPAIIAWKGAGVALLTLWAAMQARSADGWLIAAALGAGAAGDVLLDAAGLAFGGAAFAVGHVLAIILYVRNPRPATPRSQMLLATLTPPLATLIAGQLTMASEQFWLAMIYTAIVAAMASCAWTSRFPRYRTGIGAMLFLASDLLIFARLGGAVPAATASLLIWPLYFAGQALIAWGVVTTLRSK